MIIVKSQPFKMVIYDERPDIARNYVIFSGNAPVGEFQIPDNATISEMDVIPEGSLHLTVTNYDTKLIDSNGNQWLEIDDL